MKYGIDYIGGANYIWVIREHHPRGFAAGFLCKAVGWKSGIKAARALAITGRCPIMRIHGVWHDSHKFCARDIPATIKQARKVAALSGEFPDIQIYFSPWLEHYADEELFTRCRKACEDVLPATIPIVSCGNPIAGVINESHHGPLPGKYLFSYDGKCMFSQPVGLNKKQHKNAMLFFGWTPSCNGKTSESDMTPRHLRKNWLTPDDIRRIKKCLRQGA